ncbi:MAG: hypothetical protein WBY44_31760 [Bryobacteraceae bacterium]
MMAPRSFETNRTHEKSSGPVTQPGKDAVSRNALVHGLAGRRHAALPGEQPALDQFTLELRETLAPVGPLEEDIVYGIVGDRWRRRRARNMENALFSRIEKEQAGELDAATAQAIAWVDAATGLQKVAVYAHRLQRTIEKNTAELEAMQAKRKAEREKAREEALALTQLAESKGETYDPAPDFPPTESHGGFVYSAPEIARVIDRSRRLEEAKTRVAVGSAVPLARAGA